MKSVELKQGEKLGAAGGFQRGKTTTVHSIVSKAPAVLAFDPKGEWARKLGFTPCTPATILNVAADLRRRRMPLRIAVQVGTNVAHDFEDTCRVANTLHGWIIVLDELGMVISTASASVLMAFPNFSKLWRIGHSFQITVIWCTHRLSDVPVLLREVQHLLLFGAKAQRDRKLVEDEYGSLILEQLDGAPEFSYLYVGPKEPPHVALPVKHR